MITLDPQSLREGTVRLEAGDIAVLRATGADRISFLHRLTTGSVQSTSVGQSCRSLFLDNKAHILGDLRISVRKDDVRLTAVGGDAQALVAGLSRYAIMDDFTLVAEPDLQPVVLYGPGAGPALKNLGVSWTADLANDGAHADAESPFGPLWLLCHQGLGTTGLWAFGKPATAAALNTALQTVPVLDREVAEAARILAGEPKAGAEITADVFPMEVGLASALDNKKGCYLGQETIVRVRDRGLVRKRLVALRLRDDLMPSPGATIVHADKDAGHVTSVGRLPGEPPVALALLSSNALVGAEVQIRHEGQTLAAEVAFERQPWA
jgi:tRNA-modifying protein YgfZ